LNQNGKEQARLSAQLLQAEPVDLIISSDMTRAKQTAEIIAEATHAPILLDSSLKEMDHGAMEGLLYADVNERYGGFLEFPYKELGGESFAEVEARAMGALCNYKKRYLGKNLVIVTHGVVLSVLLKNIKKISLAAAAEIRIGNAEIIRFYLGEPCTKCAGDLYENRAKKH
jgi:probable phosphoglycerate mutase